MISIDFKTLLLKAGSNFAYSFFVTATTIISVDSIAKTGMTLGQLLITASIVGIVQGGVAASKCIKDEFDGNGGTAIKSKKKLGKKASVVFTILNSIYTL
jgi:hypothetical protein